MVAKPASIEHGSKVGVIFLSQVISTIQKNMHALPTVKCVKKYQNISNSLSVLKPGFFCLALDPNVTFQKGKFWKAPFQELEVNHLLLKPVAEVNFAMNSIIHPHGKS